MLHCQFLAPSICNTPASIIDTIKNAWHVQQITATDTIQIVNPFRWSIFWDSATTKRATSTRTLCFWINISNIDDSGVNTINYVNIHKYYIYIF